MASWPAWLALAALLGVAEMLTVTIYLGVIAVAAVAGAGVAALGAPAAVQVGVFAAASAGLVAGVHPMARRIHSAPPRIRTGAKALVGRTAVVVQEVDADHGTVKIGGEVWSARPYDGRQVIRAGQVVDVLEIQGATALVYAEEAP